MKCNNEKTMVTQPHSYNSSKSNHLYIKYNNGQPTWLQLANYTQLKKQTNKCYSSFKFICPSD